MRFLIDECLSLDLIETAAAAGHEAQHVARVGKAGWKDWNVAAHANAGDYVLVTNNAADFRRIYATTPLHAGLVILIPNVPRQMQQRLFAAVLDELTGAGEPVNQVLEVDLDGDALVISRYSLPEAETP